MAGCCCPLRARWPAVKNVRYWHIVSGPNADDGGGGEKPPLIVNRGNKWRVFAALYDKAVAGSRSAGPVEHVRRSEDPDCVPPQRQRPNPLEQARVVPDAALS